MTGRWKREPPHEIGLYFVWSAARELVTVVGYQEDPEDGWRVWMLGTDEPFPVEEIDLWWSEPVETPPHPEE